MNQIIKDKIQLTIDLGDANQNEKYETVYLWLIYYTAYIVADDSSAGDRRDQLYTVTVPNFGAGSNFGNIEEGWYLAIFNNRDPIPQNNSPSISQQGFGESSLGN